mmetsp:Transcript_45763/g.132016  ORF Transcript_45763/g.132016 Transcript_45763/m.132016 type:complete len:121 (-) Transcript_45763:82-444(-)
MALVTLLSKALGIRFIDARNIANEAKVSMGITGYPSEAEEVLLYQISVKAFRSLPQDQQMAMQEANLALARSIKSMDSQLSTSSSCEDRERSIGNGSSAVVPKRRLGLRKSSACIAAVRA